MPDPIQGFPNVSWYESPAGASRAENDAQMSIRLPTEAAAVSNGVAAPPPPEPSAPSRPPSDGAKLLVLRFPPPASQAPPELSGASAALHCGIELANAALTAVTFAATVPETLGASLLGLGRVVTTLASFDRCFIKDLDQQVKDQQSAIAAANCESNGGTALSTASGSVLCVRSE